MERPLHSSFGVADFTSDKFGCNKRKGIIYGVSNSENIIL